MNKISTISMPANAPSRGILSGRSALNWAAKFWFVIAIIGQWFFASYVAIFYGGSALRGDLEAWGNVLPEGIIKGDPMGNFALAGHLLLAVFIIFGGPLQFIPKVRKIAPSFHRWNGRVYMVLVLLTSVFGLYMMWTRGTVGSFIQHLGTSFDAVLIIIFSLLAWRYAVIGKLEIHRQWTLRLFLAVSGVWFFRVGLMFWVATTGGAGIDFESFTGPFLDMWSFAQYLLPLAILELYFLAQRSKSEITRYVMAVGLFIVTLAMGFGTVIAAMGMWLPRIQ